MIKKEFTPVIILPSFSNTNSFNGKELRLRSITTSSGMDAYVVLENSVYKRIFGQKKKFSNNGKKRLSVVKVSSGAKSIYREYRGVSVKDFTSEFAALSSNSILLLNNNNGEEPQLVKLSPGNRLFFYWFHPGNAVRISIRLGLLSVILGLLSVILSIL